MPALFAIATLLPLVPLALGLVLGGAWVLVAMLTMTLLVGALDMLVRLRLPDMPEDTEFPAGDTLSYVIGLCQIALIPLAVHALGTGTHSALGTIALIYTAALWLGQVGNSNAHELIHRAARLPRRFGTLLFVTLLYGQHASAHPKVHHTHVATPRDPATARMGESFYAYAPRAWIGGFREGHRAERTLLEKRFGPAWRRHDPYIAYVAGGLLCLALAYVTGGAKGLALYVVICLLAQMQLLLSDYVQHYGLERRTLPNGKPEPVGPAHSWNAPHWYSGAMMLHAPRHSDHHAHPGVPFHHLTVPPAAEAPRLPYSLPIMAGIAMSPRLWRRVMDRRAAKWWQDGPRRQAVPLSGHVA